MILAVHCNCRVISRETVTKQFFEILEQRLLDMNELLNRNIDKIAEEARKGENDMKKVVSPCFCKVYTRRGNEATARAFCKIQFENGRLSITGVIGPCRAGTAVAVLVSALMQSERPPLR